MTHQTTAPSFDWDTEPEIDAEQEYLALLRSLRRKAGFGLLFVRCSPVAGTRLIERVKTDLPDKSIGVLRFEAAIPGGDFYQQVEDDFQQQGSKEILFVQGLEYSLTSYEETQRAEANWSSEEIYNYSWKAVPRLLGNLNLRREKFRDNFATCFVFLLPLFALKYLTRRAPDFFDWRSGVFELPSPVEREFNNCPNGLQPVSEPGVLGAANTDEQAIVRLDQALQLKPDDASVWIQRGAALQRLGRYEEAIANFTEALSFQPDSEQALFGRRIALNEIGAAEM